MTSDNTRQSSNQLSVVSVEYATILVLAESLSVYQQYRGKSTRAKGYVLHLGVR
jgi:hypothetical protein